MKEIEAPEGKLAIVFTDIVKSTYIWEHEPVAMKEAMAMHDDMIRSLTVRHRGYEVKQNGDGFMVAFQSAISALEFCLEVQERLLDMSWPGKLLKLGAGSEVRAQENEEHEPEVLFKGLRLRMSGHWGEPVPTWNKTIGRMDYMGPVVNRAARFIQATEGGQIVVSEPFLEALGKAKGGTPGDSDAPAGPLFAAKAEQDDAEESNEDAVGQMLDLGDLRAEHTESLLKDKQFEVRLLGKRHFKGVSDEQKLYFIIPQSLHGRLQFWPKHMHVAGSKGNLVGPG